MFKHQCSFACIIYVLFAIFAVHRKSERNEHEIRDHFTVDAVFVYRAFISFRIYQLDAVILSVHAVFDMYRNKSRNRLNNKINK